MNYTRYTTSRLNLYCLSPYVSIQVFPNFSLIHNNKTEVSIKVNVSCEKIKYIIATFSTPSNLDLFFEENNTEDYKQIISQLINYGVIE